MSSQESENLKKSTDSVGPSICIKILEDEFDEAHFDEISDVFIRHVEL